MLSGIRRRNIKNSQSAFCTQSAVCILYLVCILYPVCSLLSAFCTDRIGLLFLFERASSPDRNIGARKKKISETFLASMIDVWTVGWGAPEEKYDDRTIITLYLLLTILYGCLWCSSAWSQRVLKWTRYGSLRCEHFGFSIQAAFLEVRKCHWRLLFLLNHKKTLFLSTRVSELHRN